MSFIYNFALLVLRIVYFFASFFNTKAKAFISGRRGIFKKLEKQLGSNTSPVIWVHCASLGEFEQARPVIEKLKVEFVKHKILLTFFSPSGFEVRKTYEQADFIFYLPWDTYKNVTRFIDTVKPVLVIFIKYEFWFHYTSELKRRNIPILSVSSIFRNEQLFFKSYGGFYRKILKNFDYFFVQNDESIRLLKSIGIQNCMKAGDTRFDRVNELVKRGDEISVVRKFKNNEKIMVIGSCWPEDLDVLLPFINENYYHIKFIIAPHEISESFMSTLEKAINSENVRYSKAGSKKVEECQVMIIDNIGMLGRLYQYGEFAFVGGAYGKGLHNILEAACYGIPIFFGNINYQKFQEAVDLINRGGAFEVSDYLDFKHKYEMLNMPQTFLLACEVTKQYVEENLGATEKVMVYCRKILKA
jgi:3-deoxy-D-manno-octulosonic-acid transferase